MTDTITDTITHKELYAQLKGIFDGCDTILDAIPFCNNYVNRYPAMKDFIYSYANSKRYNDTIDIKTKQSILYDTYIADSKNKANDITLKALEHSVDIIYKNTLERLSNSKTYKIPKKLTEHIVKIQKKCPHKKCGHIISMDKNTQYIICGYTDPIHGYDWNGCGRDWCFKCEKILCKSWEEHKLHIMMNRTHDIDCCKKHASRNSYRYPIDYCQCYIENIDIFLDITNM